MPQEKRLHDTVYKACYGGEAHYVGGPRLPFLTDLVQAVVPNDTAQEIDCGGV
jgi:hypothetical protein